VMGLRPIERVVGAEPLVGQRASVAAYRAKPTPEWRINGTAE
jgi:hypothetical protein